MRRPLETRRAYRLTIALTHAELGRITRAAALAGIPVATWIATQAASEAEWLEQRGDINADGGDHE